MPLHFSCIFCKCHPKDFFYCFACFVFHLITNTFRQLARTMFPPSIRGPINAELLQNFTVAASPFAVQPTCVIARTGYCWIHSHTWKTESENRAILPGAKKMTRLHTLLAGPGVLTSPESYLSWIIWKDSWQQFSLLGHSQLQAKVVLPHRQSLLHSSQKHLTNRVCHHWTCHILIKNNDLIVTFVPINCIFSD